MIEIKDTRKTATKDPRPKMGDVVRINKDYYICAKHDYIKDKLFLNLYSLSDGNSWDDHVEANELDQYVFRRGEIGVEDIEVITNKITLTIE